MNHQKLTGRLQIIYDRVLLVLFIEVYEVGGSSIEKDEIIRRQLDQNTAQVRMQDL